MKLLRTLLCVLSLQTVEILAQPRQMSLPVEEVLGALHFSPSTPVDLSPDGKWVAYTLKDDRRMEKTSEGNARLYFTRSGVYRGSLGCDVWITNTQTGQTKNLTEGKGSSWSPVWSPDGNHLAFYSDRNGAERLWMWERSSGKLWQASNEIVHPYYAVEVVRWSSDSRKILVKILPKGMTIEDMLDTVVSPQETEKQVNNSPTVLVYRSSISREATTRKRQDDTDKETMSRRADLTLIEVATGKSQRIATGFNPAWYEFSPDGSSVAFTTTKGYASPQSTQRVYDLVSVSLSDGRPRVIAPDIRLDYSGMTVSWSPDGRMLSYITSSSNGPVKGDCFVVSVKDSEPRNITPTPHPYFNNSFRAPLWDATGEHIYLLSPDSIWRATVNENKAEEVATILGRKILEAVTPGRGGGLWSPDGGRSMIVTTRDELTKQVGFYQIDLTTGKSERLLEERKSYGDNPIFNMDVSGDGKQVVFIAEDAAHGAEIWLTGIDFKNPKRVTHTNPQLDNYIMGTSRLIEWKGLDGETMRGALLLPPDHQEGKRYPLIVRIYPGYNLSDNVYNFGLNLYYGAGVENTQLFATRGYAVLFADSSRPKGNPMRGIAHSVLPGISKLVELGIADPERLGLIGHSNGGYGTLALIVQSTRFKAAVCSGGFGNGIGFYGFLQRDGSSWAVAYQEETLLGGPPWEIPNKYIENSPVFYLDRVQTPLLLVHGAEDTVVPSFLADEIFVGLRRLGKEVEYAKYEGEGHSQISWGYINQVDYLNRVIDWFDKHLKGPNAKSQAPDQ